jgi:hypothetical protein
MMKTQKKKVTKAQIYRSVASSSAIETGKSVDSIEKQLKSNNSKHASVTLAI